MVVARRRSNDPSVIAARPDTLGLSGRIAYRLRRRVERRRRLDRPEWVEAFSTDRSPFRSLPDQLPLHDVVHLHFVSGLVDFPSFFGRLPKDVPVVWTHHDMNAFTGGCHYDHGCGRFDRECGLCPQLASNRSHDLSRQVLTRKRSVFSDIDPARVRIVCTSRWLAGEARRSAVLNGRFEVRVIPGAVDTDVFAPLDQVLARAALDLPPDARVVLFVAHDPRIRRKGLHLLRESLRSVSGFGRLVLLSLGRDVEEIDAAIDHRHLGFVGSDRLLALVYNAADLFVIPSEQDNLPTTAMEAIACGTPVLGFDEGGIPDMVRPGVSGRVVPSGDTRALAEACQVMLADPAELDRLGETARELAIREYSLERQAKDYEKLYEDLIQAGGPHQVS